MPKPPLDQGNRSDDVKVVRKTLLGLLKFRQRPGEIVLAVIAAITKRKVSLRQVRIERESTIGGILGCRQPRRAWIVSYPVTIAVHKGETHPRRHKTGIQLHCLLIGLDRTLHVGLIEHRSSFNCATTQI